MKFKEVEEGTYFKVFTGHSILYHKVLSVEGEELIAEVYLLLGGGDIVNFPKKVLTFPFLNSDYVKTLPCTKEEYEKIEKLKKTKDTLSEYCKNYFLKEQSLCTSE